jgi:hypothetical protein
LGGEKRGEKLSGGAQKKIKSREGVITHKNSTLLIAARDAKYLGVK